MNEVDDDVFDIPLPELTSLSPDEVLGKPHYLDKSRV